ncbi:MAG: histone deacetylase [Anaerolineae bacterium]
MKVFSCDHHIFPLPPGHRFPIDKYRLLREAVAASGLVPREDLVAPEPVTDEQILRVHDPTYLEKVRTGKLLETEVRRIGFPWSPELVSRTRCSVGGTIDACRAALRDGVAVNLAGGTHHALRDRGEGYCIFNDTLIAIRTMQAEGRIDRAVVLDGDAHQGNGTAALAARDATIFTFSVHSENSFPLRKERSDLDIGLPDGANDTTYLEAWRTGVQRVLSMFPADMAIFLAGADPYEGDLLGRLALTKDGLAERDRLLFEHCERAGIPVAAVMAGGYARRVEDIVEIHLQTVRLAFHSAKRFSFDGSRKSA